jgi:hypothetical protein
MNLKSFRHIKGFGMTSSGVSVGGNGQLLQWNASWAGQQGSKNIHKYSAKVSLGMLQGNSLKLGYKLRLQKASWMDEYLKIPKQVEASAVLSSYPKISAMVTQEFTTLSTHPSLGFGMEHEVSLGIWTWIWQWTYQNSTFRVPIPVLHLGSISDPIFYSKRMYYAIYCLLVQSMVADFFQDDQDKKTQTDEVQNLPTTISSVPNEKTRKEAERQVCLMDRVAEKKRHLESQRDDGLVILRATYWLESRPVSDQIHGRIISMDATRQLQFWVSNGKLSLPSFSKSSWLGFYNLEEGSSVVAKTKWDWRIWRRWSRRSLTSQQKPTTPQLTVRYTSGGYVYEITVGETEALVLPSKRAQLLGHTNSVE